VTRLRLVQLIVTPVLVADDGEHLTPVQAAPITVPAADLDGFPASFREQLAEQEAAMNAPTDRV
jgi:hypothetical protein